MVLPAGDCNAPSSACCTVAFDIANHILFEVNDALSECYVDGCQEVNAYVTMGQDDGNVDTLSVIFLGMGPMQFYRPGMIHPHRLRYKVRLLESGWPRAEAKGAEIKYPDPAVQNRLALHVMARAETIYRRAVHVCTSRNMGLDGIRVSKSAIGNLNPIPPRGGTVGSEFEVTVDLA